uniref:hypothetical protein n=1 Tax=Serratia proteamaculans TaxID=28151 RepID=UPI001F4C45C3|nr:hypothetical protein [Serratia proteamaculans]ULG18906.1 PilO [Serratia proteamaculans]
MKQQTTYTLQNGKIWLVAGLHWQYLPLRGHRSMRMRAKEANASHWAALPTGDGQAQGSLLGTVAISVKTPHKGGNIRWHRWR